MDISFWSVSSMQLPSLELDDGNFGCFILNQYEDDGEEALITADKI